jgi:epsin
MDFSSLKEQVSNLTLYDIKAGVRKVQNGTSSTQQLLLLLHFANFWDDV